MAETSKMIERVAKVLEPQAWAAFGQRPGAGSTGDSIAYRNRRVGSLRKARSVIEAMGKPTEAMCDAVKGLDAIAIYQAMIAAALTED